MRIETLILGELKTNCYLLIERDRCLLIDPADSADFILEKIVRENLTLMGILATHGHFDHILCVGEIQLSLPVPLYIDKKSESLRLIQQIRNEAHRFAITFHRNTRSKDFAGTELTGIKGVGEKTAEKLLKHFGSVKKLKEAPQEEIIKLVGQSVAAKLFASDVFAKPADEDEKTVLGVG